MGSCYDADYNQTKVFTITDRPVYRPEQTVKYKFWVGYAKYDQPDEASAFAGQSFPVEIHNPKGEKVLAEDEEGRRRTAASTASRSCPTDATLGVYSATSQAQGISLH